ncbi:hypothetical protein P8452_17041 [Trifolium repens]|nr:hypothetical protein P8452_17041 [Trifolium repens]
MKIGWNFKTGLNIHLSSWRNSDDPSSSEYSYSVDPRGLPQLFLQKGKKKIFRSGPCINTDQCEVECSKNCSCVAYAKLDINASGNGCIAWFGDLFDIREDSFNGQDFYVRVSASKLGMNIQDSNVDRNKRKILIILPMSISVASTIIVLTLWLIIKKWRRNRAEETIIQLSVGRTKNEFELPFFEIAIIEDATRNFSFNNKIGEGGFGPVYKGQLPSGREIAVKRL